MLINCSIEIHIKAIVLSCFGTQTIGEAHSIGVSFVSTGFIIHVSSLTSRSTSASTALFRGKVQGRDVPQLYALE